MPPRRQYKPKRRFVRRRSTRVPRPHKFIIANYAPFNEDALGARIPDANTAPSFPFHVNDLRTAGLTANPKVNAYLFMPWIKPYSVAATENVGTWTWAASYGGGTDSLKQSAIANQSNGIRACAHGIRIMSPVPTTSATGFIHICLIPFNLSGATWNSAGAPSNISQMQDCPGYQRYTLAQATQSPIYVTNNWVDTTAFEYQDPDNTYAQNTSRAGGNTTGWMMICLVLENTCVTGYESNQLEIENIIHFEALPYASQSTLQPTMSAEPSKPNIMAGAANMAQYKPISSTSHESSPTLLAAINKAFYKGLIAAGLAGVRGVGYGFGSYAAASAGNYMRRGFRWAGGTIAQFYPRNNRPLRL